MKIFLSTLSFMCCLTGVLFSAETSVEKSYSAEYAFTFDNLEVTPGEEMGLAGAAMRFDLPSGFFAGPGLYGAVTGKRGGFFTVGFEGGYRYDISKAFRWSTGLFLGAGGGGAAPQGGGLMLRPYLESVYALNDHVRAGLGLSHIDFPNGEIESSQLYLTVSMDTQGWYITDHRFTGKPVTPLPVPSAELGLFRVSLLAERYLPSSESFDTNSVDQTSPFGLAGIELALFHDRSLYTTLQSAGAGAGNSDGYMEMFFGLGYQRQLLRLPLYLHLHTALGASGGGRVDTGGGLVYKLQAGVEGQLDDRLSLGIKAGMIDAFKGTFRATSYTMTLGYSAAVLKQPSKPLEALAPSAANLRILHKSHFTDEQLFKSSRDNRRVDLLGIGIDSMISKHFYLTGQSYWAYKGEAGGYAEGIIGLGYRQSLSSQFALYTEALAGVGGGGGINIGGGLFGSVVLGGIFDLGDAWEAHIGASYVQSKGSDLSMYDVIAGINYRFSLFTI